VSARYRFADFLADSFSTLRREMPNGYHAMCRSLQPRTVALTVDGEPVGVHFEPARAVIARPVAQPTIEVRTTRAAILALIDATHTLHEAVLNDALYLRGDPSDLLAFHDGLMAYVHGAVRSPSFPHLLQAFRSARAAPCA
jgi:hypothetical protein